MKVNKDITLFEFGFISKSDQASSDEIKRISAKSYDYLKKMSLSDSEDRKLFKLSSKNGVEVLQVRNYAGVIFTPDVTQIEVLPKIGQNSSDESKARYTLLVMLKALKGFSHIQTTNANILKQKMPLLEIFISQFLDSVNSLIKQGLQRDYIHHEDNIYYLKGKLNIPQQIKHNFINQHKFHCAFDDFSLNRPANRLLSAALSKVKTMIRSETNQRLLQELAHTFDDIPQSDNYKQDFLNLKSTRNMNHYKTPLAWARLILTGFSPQTMKGKNQALSLLFPMERIFENYVAKELRHALPSHLSLKSQVQEHHLVSHNQAKWFQLKPDLVITKGNQNISVLDTKWKIIDSAKANGNR